MTEDGPSPQLLRDTYGLHEADGGYDLRTELNARDSDATVIYARRPESDGTAATIQWARHYGKPCILNPTVEELRAFIAEHQVETLNVAGNRESISLGTQADVEAELIRAFGCATT